MKVALVALALTALAAPLLAHHTIDPFYDINKVVTLKGVVTEVDWHNPHVMLHLDVKNNNGTTVSWIIETKATFNLKQRGLDQGFVTVGQTVSMDVLPARDGTPKGALETIVLPSGMAHLSMRSANPR